MVQVPSLRRKGGRNYKKNYKRVALIALAGIVAGGSFALASGTIGVGSNSFLAAVFSILSAKPTIQITNDPGVASSTTPGVRHTLAIFNVKAVNVSNWATLRSLDFEVDVLNATSSPLSVGDFVINYKYCVPSGVTYGYGFSGGNCGSYSSDSSFTGAHKIQIWGIEPLEDRSGYIVHASLPIYSQQQPGQPIYPQQQPGTLSISAVSKYGSPPDGSPVPPRTPSSKLRVALIGGSAVGDQCSKFDPKISNYAYSGCAQRQTFISTPVYGNVITVVRDTVTPPPPRTGINVTFVSSNANVTAGSSANDDLGTFVIRYKIRAVGTTAYVSSLSDVRLSGNTVGKTTAIVDRAGIPITAGTSITLQNLTDTTLNAAGLYQILDGEEKTFEITAVAQLPTAGSAGQYRARLSGIRWGMNATDSTPDTSYTANLGAFVTPYIGLN